MNTKTRVLLGGIALLMLSGELLVGQATIDATAPAHDRRHLPTSGRFTSSGRKLPVQIRIRVLDAHGVSNEPLTVKFTLRNVGDKEMGLPVSINPGDLVPEPEQSYKLFNMNLTVVSHLRKESVLAGGVHLYGSHDFPSSFISLSPGESLNILAKVELPAVDRATLRSTTFIAHVVLEEQTVKKVGADVFEDAYEIGSAASAEYSGNELFSELNDSKTSQ